MKSAEVAAYIGRWRPVSVGAEAAAFARQVVAGCGPVGRDRAKNLLWAAGKLAGYGISVGLAPWVCQISGVRAFPVSFFVRSGSPVSSRTL
jgi:hypothetical protein